MANRTYLMGTQSDLIGENEEAVELLEARYCLPLFWLALLARKDIRLNTNVPVLITTRDEAIANWASRKMALQTFLGRQSDAIIAGWEQFIASQSSPYFFLNTYEIWLMEEENGQFADELASYFDDLDTICMKAGPEPIHRT